MEEISTKLQKIYDEEYFDIVNLDVLKNTNIKEAIMRDLTNNPLKERRLVSLVSTLKNITTFDKSKYVGTSFRIFEDNTTSLLGFFYNTYDLENKRIVPHSITYGAALTSQDGEYRSNNMTYDSIEELFSSDVLTKEQKEVMNIVEDLITTKINNKILNIEVKPLCSPDYPHISELSEFIDINRVFIKLYSLCWIRDFYAIESRIYENHMNGEYRKLFSQKRDYPYYEKILSIINDKEYQELRVIISSASLETISRDHKMPLIVGQKTFPLIINERMNIGDIRFPTWCEIYITNKCSNLSLNYVSPSFPFLGNWFLLYNTDSQSYDNAATMQKYNYSKISSNITKKLKKVDLLTYRENQFRISKDFKKISQQITNTITFANTRLNLSPTSVGIMSEYVGRTIKDTIEIFKLKKSQSQIFATKDHFNKFIFEILYAFYVANSVAGVIHCDPHTNNMTVYRTFYDFSNDSSENDENNKNNKNKKEIYFVSGQSTLDDPLVREDKTYSFPYTGEYAMLIDYSRGILRDRESIKREFSRQVYKDFCQIQNNSFYKTIIAVFPELAIKQERELKRFVYERFDEAFKIFSGIDTIIACKSIIEILNQTKVLSVSLQNEADEKAILQKLNDIILFVDKEIVENFNTILTGNSKKNFTSGIMSINEALMSEIGWINREVITNFFQEYSIISLDDSNSKNLKIEAFWNSSSKMKNDITNYDKWGKMVSPETIKEMLVTNGNWVNYEDKQAFDNFMRNLKTTRDFDVKIADEIHEQVILEPWMFE